MHVVLLHMISHNYDSVMEYAMINIEAALAKAVEHLGYEQLSLEQCAAIKHFVAGQYVFLFIPTGTGKSLLLSCANSPFHLRHRVMQLTLNEFKHTSRVTFCTILGY